MSLRTIVIRTALMLVFFQIMIPPWKYANDPEFPDSRITAYRFFLTPPPDGFIETGLLSIQVFITTLIAVTICYSVSPRPLPLSTDEMGESHQRGHRRRSSRLRHRHRI